MPLKRSVNACKRYALNIVINTHLIQCPERNRIREGYKTIVKTLKSQHLFVSLEEKTQSLDWIRRSDDWMRTWSEGQK